jgi:hypothetical protein
MSEALERAVLAASHGGPGADAGRAPAATSIVVSHGAAIKAYVASLLGNVTPSRRPCGALGTLSNTAVTVLEREPGGATRLVVVERRRAPPRSLCSRHAKTAVEAPPPARSSRRAPLGERRDSRRELAAAPRASRGPSQWPSSAS